MIFKKMHCEGGSLPLKRTSTGGGGANRWTCADMGEGGSKISNKTADVLCEWRLSVHVTVKRHFFLLFFIKLATHSTIVHNQYTNIKKMRSSVKIK